MAALPANPKAAMAANPHASLLTVCNGRHAIGRIVDTLALKRGSRGSILAYDLDDSLVGVFTTRQAAAAALPRTVG